MKVDEHKSHLLLNILDMEKPGAAMTCDFAIECDKRKNCQDTVYKIELAE